MKKANNIFLILPIISGVMWGTTGPFVRMLIDAGFNNITVFFSRVLIASVVLFIGMFIVNRDLLKIRLKDIWIFLLSGGVGMTGLNLCYNQSITTLTLSLAAVLLALSPVFVLILAAIFFREKITAQKTICMVLAIVGAILVSGLLEQAGALTWSVGGLMIGFLSAFLYAIYSIASRIAMGRGYDSFTIIFYSMLVATIVLCAFADWHAIGNYVQTAPVKHSGILLIHSAFSSILPYICFTLGLSRADTGMVSILASAGEPVAATVLGMLIYQEQPTVLTIAGLVLTIVALAILVRPKKEAHAAEVQ